MDRSSDSRDNSAETKLEANIAVTTFSSLAGCFWLDSNLQGAQRLQRDSERVLVGIATLPQISLTRVRGSETRQWS